MKHDDRNGVGAGVGMLTADYADGADIEGYGADELHGGAAYGGDRFSSFGFIRAIREIRGQKPSFRSRAQSHRWLDAHCT